MPPAACGRGRRFGSATHGGLKGCMGSVSLAETNVCEPRESFDPPSCSTDSSPPIFRLSFRASQRRTRYRGRQAQQDPLAILVETLTTEVIDTTTTAARHEALFFSFRCHSHRNQPRPPLQPQLCDSCHCEPYSCEIGSVLERAPHHHRHSRSLCSPFLLNPL